MRALIASLAAASLAAIVVLALAFLRPGEEGPQWHERTIVYRLEVRNETRQVHDDRTLDVFVPPDIRGRQRRLSVQGDRDVEVVPAPGGNAVARVALDRIAPFGAARVRLRVHVAVAKRSAADAGEPVRQTRFPADHADIRRVAARLDGGDRLATARNVRRWVAGHMTEVGYVARDRGALHALREGTGDCTEYMSLTAALLDAAGIPVRALGGFRYDRDRVAAASDFHNWVEVPADARWWVVDPQVGTFTDRTSGRIVVRRLTAPATTHMPSQGLFKSMDGFDVRML